MTVKHATFTIERTYPATPDRVWHAWSDQKAKERWFIGPDEWVASGHVLDFRVGGTEHVAGGEKGGVVHRYDAVYQDIVVNERIVTTYQMYQDDKRSSVSVATIELFPDEEGTRLVYTEQGAFFDELDEAKYREQGTNALLDQLGRELS